MQDTAVAVDTTSIVRNRRLTAAALTVFIVALGIVMWATLGSVVMPIYAVGLPMGLCLLWFSTDTLRADERGAPYEEPEPWPIAPAVANRFAQSH
jgi:hypothetical protein